METAKEDIMSLLSQRRKMLNVFINGYTVVLTYNRRENSEMALP